MSDTQNRQSILSQQSREELLEELLASQRRCGELETLNKALDEELITSQKQASLSQFVAGMAHEINTPIGVALTALSFFSESTEKLKKKYEDKSFTRKDFEEYLGSGVETLNIMTKNMARAAQLMGSFKNLSVDQHCDTIRDIEVKSYLDEIVLMLRPVLKRTTHQVKCLVPDGWVIHSYPGAFVQVITNLIMNSLVHGFEGVERGEIQIDMQPDPQKKTVVINYRDNGVGMTPEVQKRLFEPFFTTKKGKGGTGLGMPIIENIVVKQLKGSLTLTTHVGSGVHFRIEFPERVEP